VKGGYVFMKKIFAILVSVLFFASLSLAVVGCKKAEEQKPAEAPKKGNMVAYVIGHITVKDPKKWAEYRSKVPATLAPWGAELVLRGIRVNVLAGKHVHTDVVVIRFPNTDSAVKWYSSQAYQALIPIRTQAADMDLVIYESTA
jgi:uncharacterized protein (DUF1330 family)